MRRLGPFLILLTALLLTAAACGGDDDADIGAPATAAAETVPRSSFNVVARNIQFDTDTLVIVAGAEVVISFNNQDSAPHNIAVYTEKGGDEIFRGEIFPGPETREYRFQAPDAGVYYFRCDVHSQMEGVFIAR